MLPSDKILDLIHEPLADTQIYLVDLSIDQKNNIKIVLDSDGSVSLSDCVTISRAIENNLDREKEDFSLEVTSAGLGQPLKQERQYQKYIGKEIEVLGKDGTKHLGKLISLNAASIKMVKASEKKKKMNNKETEENILQISFNEIKQTKGVVKV